MATMKHLFVTWLLKSQMSLIKAPSASFAGERAESGMEFDSFAWKTLRSLESGMEFDSFARKTLRSLHSL